MNMREFKKMLDRESELRTAYEKGYAIGYAEGNLQVAKEMKAYGLSIEMIMHYTHLTQEQIAQF